MGARMEGVCDCGVRVGGRRGGQKDIEGLVHGGP